VGQQAAAAAAALTKPNKAHRHMLTKTQLRRKSGHFPLPLPITNHHPFTYWVLGFRPPVIACGVFSF
jgi:hypothetical protein